MPTNLIKFLSIYFLLLSILQASISPEYSLSMDVEKEEIFLGEKSFLTLTLEYKGLEDYEIIEPAFEDITLKEVSDTEYKNSRGFWVNSIKFELTPHKSRVYNLQKQSASIEYLTSEYKNFNNKYKYTKKKTTYSNTTKFRVVKLPKGISIAGNYKLKTSVNTKELNASKPLTFSIKLQGSGNFNTLSMIDFNITNATIYKKSKSSDTQTFTIVANEDYTIPAIALEYFNIDSKQVEYLLSKPINIKVKQQKISSIQKYFYVSFLITVILLCIFILKKVSILIPQTTEEIFIKKLIKTKTQEELLLLIAPHLGKSNSIDRLIYKLENREYTKFKVFKKVIIKKMKYKFI